MWNVLDSRPVNDDICLPLSAHRGIAADQAHNSEVVGLVIRLAGVHNGLAVHSATLPSDPSNQIRTPLQARLGP
jgi:hypothetical protein